MIKICRVCGKEYKVTPTENKYRKTCSRKCANKWQSEHIRGKNHPQFTDTKIICQYCGKIFKSYPSRLGHTKYCSKECRDNANRKMIKKICLFCGKIYYRVPSNKNKYCSRECQANAYIGYKHTKIAKQRMSNAQKGFKSHMWKGGWEETLKRRKNNSKYQLRQRMIVIIRYSLKKYNYKKQSISKTWELLVGYTIKELKERLQKTMPTGYAWQEFLNGKLHIDHVLPVRLFEFKTSEDNEFRQCWSLFNLRLLPAKENLRKSDKITNPILLWLLLNLKEKEVIPCQR